MKIYNKVDTVFPNFLTQLTTALAVHVHKLVEVEAGPLHNLHLPDVHVVEGVDSWRDIFQKSVAIFQMKEIEGKLNFSLTCKSNGSGFLKES